MAARSIASLSLSFGLVSIPVKLYSATESSATVRFNNKICDGKPQSKTTPGTAGSRFFRPVKPFENMR